jgi:hypothetical protein
VPSTRFLSITTCAEWTFSTKLSPSLTGPGAGGSMSPTFLSAAHHAESQAKAQHRFRKSVHQQAEQHRTSQPQCVRMRVTSNPAPKHAQSRRFCLVVRRRLPSVRRRGSRRLLWRKASTAQRMQRTSMMGYSQVAVLSGAGATSISASAYAKDPSIRCLQS